jgi:hypothetical protein
VTAVTLSGIPSELATLDLVCMVESSDTSTFQQPPVCFVINGDESPVYDFHHTTISGAPSPGSTTPVIFAEERTSELYGFGGIAKGQMAGSRPTTSCLTFGNWGTGSGELCYTGHFNSSSQSTLAGGTCDVARPYTSMTLWTTYNIMAGSSFTIQGRYP